MGNINNNENTADNSRTEIDIAEIFGMLAHKWIIIVAAGVIAAVLAFGYFHFIATPKYTSSASIMVINRQNTDAITATDLTSSTTLSNDYVEIIKSRTVLEQVIADLDLDYDVEKLSGKISASVITNTRKISIKVTDEDPILAKKIADSVVEASSKRICEIMNIENMVSTVDNGDLPDKPSSPATKRNTIIAALVGIVLAAAVIIIVGIKDDRIKTQEDVEKYLGTGVLGIIPLFEAGASQPKETQASASKQGGKQ